MKIKINKKDFVLRFGMGCWERFQGFILEQAENPAKGSLAVNGFCNLILAAIGNANDIEGLDQEIDRKALYEWIDTVGVTEKGNQTLMKIEAEFQNTMQYKAFLKIAMGQKKTPNQKIP